MEIYVSFLRGVNMTGHNKMRMTELSGLYRELGFGDAETYIQSGNVIFTGPDDMNVSDIRSKTEIAIREKFNYEVPVIIRTVNEIRELIPANPFLSEEDFIPSKMAVIFLHENPSAEQINKVMDIDFPPDKFKIIGSEIFVFCPDGFGRTKLYTNFFEKKMGVTGTARNWKTISTILELLEKRLN